GPTAPRRSLTAMVDITEQQAAARALRDSEERYRSMVEQSPLAITEYDFADPQEWFGQLRTEGVADLGEYLAANPGAADLSLQQFSHAQANEACVRFFGASSRDELVRRLGEIQTPDSHAMRTAGFVLVWRGQNSVEGECALRRLDGREVFARYYARAVMNDREGGRILRTQTILIDITEQRRAEQSLRESETRYRELFENAVGGVYRSDAAGRFISINPAFARLLGYETPAEILRRNSPGFTTSLYVKPGRREEFITQFSPGDRVTSFESEMRVRDGSTVWISEDARAVRDAAGRLLYLDGFVTDITARRRLEDELLRASKLEAVGILAGGIAHDFNNILTVVLGNVTLAEMDTDTDKSISRMLRDAKQATLRARDLTQQLLTFAKGGDPVRATVALPELLRESAGFALHGAKARPVYELADDLWPANVDKGQIGQVVQNLVINAVQAMPQGGTITLRAANVALEDRSVGILPGGDYIRLSVSDTGVGIPSDHLSKIFDPYFTTKQSGSGLGLATVYSVIRKHQGHIEVESRLGFGTTFSFWLPAAPHEQAAAPVAVPATARLQGRVLFMDDEEPIREMAGMFMQRLGLHCDLTAEGVETVAKYRAALEAGQPYDLVIMDLTVPGGMGGREAMQQLKAIHPSVMAIVSSGYSRDPVLANFRAHGFSGILPKPYSLDQLQEALGSALGGGRTRTPF
ncbi:MAG: ATP-binding protein, partial [Opitutales bacterium]